MQDAARIEAVLTSHPDIEKDDDGGYVWVDRDGEREEDLGSFTVGGGQLVFHADSEDLAERGRLMIERAAGAAIRYVGIHTGEVDDAEGDDGVPPLTPEVEAKVLDRYYDGHYRRWLDGALPALAGLSPRKAMHVPSLRPQVAALLRGIDDRWKQAREAGGFAYDAGWLWEALGLAPDGADAAAPVIDLPRRHRRRPAPRGEQAGFGWERPGDGDPPEA